MVLGNIKYLVIFIVLVISILFDLKYDKIPNKAICFGVVVILGGIIHNYSYEYAIFSLGGMIFPLICLFPLFYFHMLGAGDIKLLVVIGGFFGWKGALSCVVLSIFFGAIISIYKLYKYQLFRERFAYFFHYTKLYMQTGERRPYYDHNLSDKVKLHFSIPIGIGTFVYSLYIFFGGGMFI